MRTKTIWPWPLSMTLKFNRVLAIVKVQANAKFHQDKCSSSRFKQTTKRRSWKQYCRRYCVDSKNENICRTDRWTNNKIKPQPSGVDNESSRGPPKCQPHFLVKTEIRDFQVFGEKGERRKVQGRGKGRGKGGKASQFTVCIPGYTNGTTKVSSSRTVGLHSN